MRVVILQPSYLPWLGFFEQMYRSDVFVVYDDVQYDKHGWRNRNRIKTAQGEQWLTVPILTRGQDKPLIKEVMINNKIDWRQNHLKSIKQNYSKSPFFNTYFKMFEEIYSKEWGYLIDVDMAFIVKIMDCLGLVRRLEMSSSLNIKGESTQRIVDICSYLGASHYLTGDSAKDYLDESLFAQNNITLEYQHYHHPIYNQLYGEFIPYLSIIDLLFNYGDKSLDILANKVASEVL